MVLALMVENLLANAGDVRDTGLIPGSGRSPGRENGNPQPTLVVLLGKSQGQRSLVEYGLWGQNESDMTASEHSLSTAWLDR